MSDPILYEQSGGVVTLTINRPEKRNPISEPEVVEALVAALARMNQDRSVRAAILTGAGSGFSSGGDINAMQSALEERASDPVRTQDYYSQGIQLIPLAFEKLEVPIIAAVNGAAIGAGCDLACMCDIRIAGASARFAESFVKLGIIAGDGGAWLLPRIVGFSKACELAFTGDMLDAQAALACGLVSQVVPDGELMAASRALAERIAANPGHATRMTKRLLVQGRTMALAASLEMAAAMQSLAHAAPDHREAVSAFLEKRSPQFNSQSQ
jgi:enoyl-CoA hydratase/carnithine racemase